MAKSKTIEILKELASGGDGRSESARLADIIEDVENALKAGVKRQAILDALHRHYGFKMTMSGFEKALRKLRTKEKTKSNGKIITRKNSYTDLISDNIINQVYPYVNNGNNDKSIISDQAYLMDKENTNDRVDIKEDDSKKYHTPDDIRKIREKTLKELDDDLNGNYD
ncbi:MAG: hypothetical protein Q8K07_17905 [Methylicorpusculum sp.]|uniref:hypothetical protein n=1 Tax=Methylicorpusculum sp. TaxID=2713644 RepID=UPI002725105A|nr:hypothetical protein [Methylicorpusculum sp.]MDO9240839.1 hypothetical protein [Methylicorpusculum sp.]MDP2177089.1 hypothetical protein [Methylicorpusculum sp.]MDP2203896.1 hypothetical protein [Methylicorpusculum sp.]MDP3529330.1 hypothetical protein [Methylicorpusculum sp.]MDZ4150494.1 hypothetical protein [Methylicorpusculum sp.]